MKKVLSGIEEHARWVAAGAVVFVAIGVFVLEPAAERIGLIGDRAIAEAMWYRVFTPDSGEVEVNLPFSSREDCEMHQQLNQQLPSGRLSGCISGSQLKEQSAQATANRRGKS